MATPLEAHDYACRITAHFNRRTLLKAAGASGLAG